MFEENLERAQERIIQLYSASAFQAAGEKWLKVIVDHFRRVQQRQANVLNWCEPQRCVEDAAHHLDGNKCSPHDKEAWLRELEARFKTMLNRGQNLHHPRYVGHQVPASLPIAALFDAIGSVTNQVMAIYEMGPWSTAVERAMIQRLGRAIGFAEDAFAGLVTHGGSLANLTALLTARNVALENVWRRGIDSPRNLALVVQNDVHYCIARSAGILGIGTDQIVRVPVDHRRRMDTTALARTLDHLKSEGRTVIGVVAGACSTPIGAFDPLDRIADICEEHGVWMHVDAAHGGATVFSQRHRHLVQGLNRADSVVLDAHKMLFMPALCAFTFYKDKRHRFVAFEQDAPYLFDPANPGSAEFDSGTQTLECTKRAAAFALWGVWSIFGEQLFADLIDVTFAMTQELNAQLTAADDFEPLHTPECNIQVFRYRPPEAADWPADRLGDFQLRLRQTVIRSGMAYLVPIKIDGVGALRATVINPCTKSSDLSEVLQAVRDSARQVVAS